MKFFAQGIRIVESHESPNNTSGGSTETNVPVDLEIATQGGIVAGQPVLVVPYEMILTGTKAREELGPIPKAEESLKENLPSFYLMVKLLKECERGTSSMWYDWLNSLPWWFCNGSSLMEPCWEFLPKPVSRLVQQEHKRFQDFVKALQNATCLSPRIRKDEALLHWAFCVVSTRSIPLTQRGLNYTDAQLIPNADMFNHAHASQASIKLETDPTSGNCLAVATRNISAGNPLRRSYDNSSPSHLLARYGFVDEMSPVVPCLFHIDNPTNEVCRVGYDSSRMVFYKDSGEVAQEVWDVLLYHLVLDQFASGRVDDNTGDKNRPRDRRALFDAIVNQKASTKKKIHAKYYLETSQALRSHVKTVLKELDGFLDKASTAGTDTTDTNPRLFLITRHNLFLKQVFSRVHARLFSQKSSSVPPEEEAQKVWEQLQKY